MAYEYLLFNLLVLSGPVLFSFDQRVRFVAHWRQAWLAVAHVAPFFLAWDIFVSGRHWWFNSRFTAGPAVLGLPLGEWLFFFTVPFACLFIWQIFIHYDSQPARRSRKVITPAIVVAALAAFAALAAGKEYTALALMVFSLALYVGSVYKIFDRSFLIYFLLILFGLILLCNGYLTARPVVLYDNLYITGLRIYTIPIEDFFYGYALVFLTVAVYERLRRRNG
jgi:lycopene cyclase domain-containing protein